ncbi:hypothetical protein MRX96_038411 [Rhipicephalus microplus]
MLSVEDAPRYRGRSGGRSGSRHRGAFTGCSGPPLQVDRTCPGKFHFSASLHLKARARCVGADQVPHLTHTTSNSKKPTLLWAYKARGRPDPNDWTTTNPANTATVSTDHFRDLTDSSDKTNAV